MLTEAQALLILARYAPSLIPTALTSLLAERTEVRTTTTGTVTLYDPYRAAIGYLMSPDTVKARTEGSVSETYIDPVAVAAFLQGESVTLRESWPLAVISGTATAHAINTDLDYRGWST